MKNTMQDLHNHLFARIEALSDESLAGEALNAEIRRTEATVKLAATVVEVGSLQVRAWALSAEYGDKPKVHPLLTGGS